MNTIGSLSILFLTLRNHLKLFHWKTTNYAHHMASDAFVTDFDKLTDQFIEVIQGGTNKRLTVQSIQQITDHDLGITAIKTNMKLVRKTMENLEDIVSTTDVLAIRDEIIALINKTLYLFSLE